MNHMHEKSYGAQIYLDQTQGTYGGMYCIL